MLRIRLLLSALVVTIAPACGGSVVDESTPNLVLISIDTLRADRLGCYGNDEWGRSPSPAIDKLARQGVLFEAATVPRGQTRPAIAAMLTGKYPITTGLRENGFVLLPEHRTLFEELHDAGFYTGIFVANLTKDRPAGSWAFRGADELRDGFEDRANEVLDHGTSQRIWDDRVEQAALSFLERVDGDAPFALWVHFYDVHKPYNPPSPWERAYGLGDDAEELSIAMRAGTADFSMAIEQEIDAITLGDAPVSETVLRRIRGLYDGGVTATDARIERVIAKLEQIGELDDSVVVLTSDHGEELYDRNRYFYHGNSVYDGVVQIPLIVRAPGLPTGARVDAHVQNIDLPPTLLELLGLDGRMTDVEGRTLVPLLSGRSTEPPRPYSFIEWQDLVYAVVDGQHKYVHNPSHVHLRKAPFHQLADPTVGYRIDCFEAYDLTTDPGEQVNLLADLDPAKLGRADNLPESLRPLRRALDAFLADPRHEKEMSLPGASEETKEAMREMGYFHDTGENRRDVAVQPPCRDG